VGVASVLLSNAGSRPDTGRGAAVLAANWPSHTMRTSTLLLAFAKRLRPHFHSIYAYCRISDDLGDEVENQAQALALLDVWQEQLDACLSR